MSSLGVVWYQCMYKFALTHLVNLSISNVIHNIYKSDDIRDESYLYNMCDKYKCLSQSVSLDFNGIG